jgi:hypothetical protein
MEALAADPFHHYRLYSKEGLRESYRRGYIPGSSDITLLGLVFRKTSIPFVYQRTEKKLCPISNKVEKFSLPVPLDTAVNGCMSNIKKARKEGVINHAYPKGGSNE